MTAQKCLVSNCEKEVTAIGENNVCVCREHESLWWEGTQTREVKE